MDACSIILLAKASVLESATAWYDLYLTKQVYNEVLEGKPKMFPDSLLLERLQKEGKIRLIEADQKILEKMTLDFNMGKGEASTIAVGIKENNMLIVTDNRQGRKAALVNNLPLAGSPEMVAVLLKKKRIKKEKAREALMILKEEGWFELYIIEKALEEVNNG